MVFGVYGVYRLPARTLGIEEKSSGRLGGSGFELVNVWEKERGLTASGPTSQGAFMAWKARPTRVAAVLHGKRGRDSGRVV